MTIRVTSAVFEEGEPIPTRYTCSGVDISPPLEWNNLPENTESLAIIVEDPDAPGGLWTHWIIYNLPGDAMSLPEHVMGREKLDNGAEQGLNDFGRVGYGGPCPPNGTHRYFYKIYALDMKLEMPPLIKRDQLLGALKGHILDEGQLMGVYTR